MPKSVSFHNGFNWSRGHNVRDHRFVKEQSHIDKSLENQNIIIRDEPVKQAYDRIFGEAVIEYNSKQKRADRKIQNYYEKIKSDKKKHTVYECIVQIGNNDDTGNNAPSEKEALKRFAESWEQRNPNLRLIGAYIHADEPNGTVHMHIDYIPVAECSRGMKLQNSFDRALQQQGFQTYSVKQTAQIAWQERERKALIEICQELNIDVYKTPQGITKGREHLTKVEFQELKEEAKQQMELELLPYKSLVKDFLQAEPQEKIDGVPVPTAAKMFIPKDNREKQLYSADEIEKLRQLAKAIAVISEKNQHEKLELYLRSANLIELELKTTKALFNANNKVQQAEQKLQQASDEAKTIKQEADNYATQMKEFYAERFPYVQCIIEEKKQLINDLKTVKAEKDTQIQAALKEKQLGIMEFSKERKDLKQQITDQSKQIDDLKKQLKSLEPVQQQNSEMSERIRALEDELREKEHFLGQNKEKMQELLNNNNIINKLYAAACEIGEYICKKIGLDFHKILDKRLDGYILSYIIDEEQNRDVR